MDQVPARHLRFLDVDAEAMDLPLTTPSVSCSHGAWCLLDLDATPPRFYFASSLPLFAPDQALPPAVSLWVEDLRGQDLGWRIVLELPGHTLAFLCGGELDRELCRRLRRLVVADVVVRYIDPLNVEAVEGALQDRLASWLEEEDLAEGGSLAAQSLHRDALLEAGVVTYWTALLAAGEVDMPLGDLRRAPFTFKESSS